MEILTGAGVIYAIQTDPRPLESPKAMTNFAAQRPYGLASQLKIRPGVECPKCGERHAPEVQCATPRKKRRVKKSKASKP